MTVIITNETHRRLRMESDSRNNPEWKYLGYVFRDCTITLEDGRKAIMHPGTTVMYKVQDD